MSIILARFPKIGGLKDVNGTLRCKPSRRHIRDDGIVLPQSFNVVVKQGVSTFNLSNTGPDWCWQIEEDIPGGITRWVIVTADSNYEDLVDVDPNTFDPLIPPVQAWWGIVESLQNSLEAAGLVDDALQASFNTLNTLVGTINSTYVSETELAQVLSSYLLRSSFETYIDQTSDILAELRTDVDATITTAVFDAYKSVISTNFDQVQNELDGRTTSEVFEDFQTATLIGMSDLQEDISTKIDEDQKNVPNGLATLGFDGKLLSSQLPAIAVSEYLGHVANQAAMLQTEGQRGDWVTRADDGRTYILVSEQWDTLSAWKSLQHPAGIVLGGPGTTNPAEAIPGNDPRLSDPRDPKNHLHNWSDIRNYPELLDSFDSPDEARAALELINIIEQATPPSDTTAIWIDTSEDPDDITPVEIGAATPGDVAAALSWRISGSGSPLGRVIANVGVEYTDITAALGARRWFKKSGTGSTGWVVIEGDTEWRNISYPDGWVGPSNNPISRIRRVNNLVTLDGRIMPVGANVDIARSLHKSLWGVPVGYRPNSYLPRGTAVFSNMMGFVSTIGSQFTLGMQFPSGTGNTTAADIYSISASWLTDDPWPTSIPV